MPASADDGLIFTDLGSGDKNAAYGAVLTGQGFTLDNINSDTANGLYIYAKEIAPASGVHGAKTAIVGTAYSAATGDAATIYPNGIWRIYFFVQQEELVENVTLEDVNAEFASKKLLTTPTQSILPALTLPEGCTKIDFIDGTASFISEMQQYMAYFGVSVNITYAYSAEVHFYYPEANAEDAVADLSAQLITAGFRNETSQSGETDLTTFTLASETAGSLIITVDKAMTTATSTEPATYKGFIYLSVSHFAMER